MEDHRRKGTPLLETLLEQDTLFVGDWGCI